MTTEVSTRFNEAPIPRRYPPLAQVEILLLFHPELQSGGPHRVSAETCNRASQHWLTLDVYGQRRTSEISGHTVMENLRLELNGEDLESLLPEGIVSEVADYVLHQA